MRRENLFTQMIILSIIIHSIIIFVFSVTYKKPILLVPKTVTVKFANINEVKVNSIFKEKKKSKSKFKLKNLIKNTKEVFTGTKKSESIEKKPKSYEEIKKEHKEKLEELLKEIQESKQENKDVEKNIDNDLLGEEELKDVEKKLAEDNVSDNKSYNASSSGAIALNNKNRRIEYQPPLPRYPQWAKEEGIQGKVKVKVWFDKDGFPVEAKVIESSGNSRLDIIAKNYALQFKLEPIEQDIEETGIVIVRFVL